MYLDKLVTFDDDVDLAQTNAVYYSTYCLDTWGGNTAMPTMPNPGGTPIDDIGRGKPVELLVQATEGFTTSAGGTIAVALVSSTAANLFAGTSIVVHAESETLAAATAVAGYRFRLRAVPAGVTQRYLGMRYTIGTGAMTAGKITAAIVDAAQDVPSI